MNDNMWKKDCGRTGRRWFGFLGIGLVLLAVWCVFSVWISYHGLVVTEYEVGMGAEDAEEEAERLVFENGEGAKTSPFDDMIEDAGKIRLVVLADLHENEFGEKNERLIETVRRQEPDLIALDGDMLNRDSTSHDSVVQLIKALDRACGCPIFYALGNHEEEYAASHPGFLGDMEAAGAVYLEEEYIDIIIKGQKLRIGGLYGYAFALDADNTMTLERMDQDVVRYLLDFQDTDAYKIMLAHRPDSFIFAQEPDFWDIDLVVSGHVHGGQVVLPFVGGLWAPDQGYFPEYTKGVYELGDMKMVITSGLGSQDEKVPRCGNVPEVMVVDVKTRNWN